MVTVEREIMGCGIFGGGSVIWAGGDKTYVRFSRRTLFWICFVLINVCRQLN
jgi:hypothetical protein